MQIMRKQKYLKHTRSKKDGANTGIIIENKHIWPKKLKCTNNTQPWVFSVVRFALGIYIHLQP